MMTTEEREELKREIMQELTAKKCQDSAWKQAKASLKDEVARKYGLWESFRVLDSAATIGRMMWGRINTSHFNNNDINTINSMMHEMLEVADKYSKRGA